MGEVYTDNVPQENVLEDMVRQDPSPIRKREMSKARGEWRPLWHNRVRKEFRNMDMTKE